MIVAHVSAFFPRYVVLIVHNAIHNKYKPFCINLGYLSTNAIRSFAHFMTTIIDISMHDFIEYFFQKSKPRLLQQSRQWPCTPSMTCCWFSFFSFKASRFSSSSTALSLRPSSSLDFCSREASSRRSASSREMRSSRSLAIVHPSSICLASNAASLDSAWLRASFKFCTSLLYCTMSSRVPSSWALH
uniref:Uncharacterized protein n=1 Tax=Rhipicephalus microplus TaxID=6941 RepID=A0A6G5AHM4_RHIMP